MVRETSRICSIMILGMIRTGTSIFMGWSRRLSNMRNLVTQLIDLFFSEWLGFLGSGRFAPVPPYLFGRSTSRGDCVAIFWAMLWLFRPSYLNVVLAMTITPAISRRWRRTGYIAAAVIRTLAKPCDSKGVAETWLGHYHSIGVAWPFPHPWQCLYYATVELRLVCASPRTWTG